MLYAKKDKTFKSKKKLANKNESRLLTIILNMYRIIYIFNL